MADSVVYHDSSIVGTDAIDMLETQYGFAHGIDGRTYVLMSLPTHNDLLPDKMVGCLGVPVLGNANIPQGEPVALLWLDSFSALDTEGTLAVVVPVHQKVGAETAKTLRKLMYPKEIDRDSLAIRRTEIQAILENNLYDGKEEEQALASEVEHIDTLLDAAGKGGVENHAESASGILSYCRMD